MVIGRRQIECPHKSRGKEQRQQSLAIAHLTQRKPQQSRRSASQQSRHGSAHTRVDEELHERLRDSDTNAAKLRHKIPDVVPLQKQKLLSLAVEEHICLLGLQMKAEQKGSRNDGQGSYDFRNNAGYFLHLSR